MSGREKPIVLTHHAQERMAARGATAAEVEEAIRSEIWSAARRGKWMACRRFSTRGASPATGKIYVGKTIEVIFSDEEEQLAVITVKVYYDEEAKNIS